MSDPTSTITFITCLMISQIKYCSNQMFFLIRTLFCSHKISAICIDIHAPIQEFLSGRVQAQWPENNLNVFFLFCVFLVLNLQFTEGVQWSYYRENYTFRRIQRSRGGPTFSRGREGPTFSNSHQMRKQAYFVCLI